MKEELKIIRFNMINNLIIAIIKVIGGLYFKLDSLYADGMHTFSDFITDIVSVISSKITKKKPTKYHPSGFGQVEYLTNIFVGVFLFALATYIVADSILKKSVVIIPLISVLIVLIVCLILKMVSIVVTNKVGKEINSNVLITAVQESKTDLYSTFGVIIISILLRYSDVIPILKYSDLVGSIIIGVIIYKTALTIIISNSLSIISEVDFDKEKMDLINEYLVNYKEIKDSKLELMKYGPYYKLNIILELDQDISLRKAELLLNNIKRKIMKNKKLKVKYVTIYITDNV